MSAVEFGLASQAPFVETPSYLPFEEHYNQAATVDHSEDRENPVDEPSSEAGFERIVGRSAVLRRV